MAHENCALVSRISVGNRTRCIGNNETHHRSATHKMIRKDLKKFIVSSAAITVAVVVLWMRYQPTIRATVQNFFSPFWQIRSVPSENADAAMLDESKEELIERISRLETELENQRGAGKRLRALKNENRELRQLLGVAPSPFWKPAVARVISRDPASGGRRLTIDKGANEGIRVGHLVLANGYLHGRVGDVADDSATVITVIDPNCSVPVIIPEIGAEGIMFGEKAARWSNDPLCVVNYLFRDLNYKLDMSVQTSELSRDIPPGIPVGTVVLNSHGNVAEVIDTLYARVHVKPQAVHSSFQIVLVLTGGTSRVQVAGAAGSVRK